ncbi:tetratricopeptide repeat protein [Synechocystis sp. PCC 7509]|uniref:tetratricopeptide repeat protein n=1 Tax=Synechocystis sp. PCC 7509 TaxID=927677 RepID=UPI0002ABEB2F|nr:tetratricopeptide repeat protein [Synechocystis sp. PCC 7509]
MFSRAIAFIAAIGIVLTVNKPVISQNHSEHHSVPSPSETSAERESSRLTESHVNEGLTKLHQKNYSGAIESFGKAVEIQPSHYLAFTYRADIHRLLKNYQAAIDDYTKAIEFNPAHSYLRNSRGVSYAALGDYQNAIEDYTQAISIYPEEGAGYRHRGAAYYQLGENEKAMADLNSAISRNQKDAEAYTIRGEIYTNLKNPDLAIADYQQAAKLFLTQSNREGYTKAINLAKSLQQQSIVPDSK